MVWPLDESQGSSLLLLQGHGSWLVCEVALGFGRCFPKFVFAWCWQVSGSTTPFVWYVEVVNYWGATTPQLSAFGMIVFSHKQYFGPMGTFDRLFVSF